MKIKTFLMDKVPNYNRLVIPYHLTKAAMAAHKYGFPGKRLLLVL